VAIILCIILEEETIFVLQNILFVDRGSR